MKKCNGSTQCVLSGNRKRSELEIPLAYVDGDEIPTFISPLFVPRLIFRVLRFPNPDLFCFISSGRINQKSAGLWFEMTAGMGFCCLDQLWQMPRN